MEERMVKTNRRIAYCGKKVRLYSRNNVGYVKKKGRFVAVPWWVALDGASRKH